MDKAKINRYGRQDAQFKSSPQEKSLRSHPRDTRVGATILPPDVTVSRLDAHP